MLLLLGNLVSSRLLCLRLVRCLFRLLLLLFLLFFGRISGWFFALSAFNRSLINLLLLLLFLIIILGIGLLFFELILCSSLAIGPLSTD